MSATNVVRLQDTNPISGQSVFGIQLGKDVSNNFTLTIAGLAVRVDGRLYAFDKTPGVSQPLQDVTGLELSLGTPSVYRLPVTTLNPGDLIVTSDSPFEVLFVTKFDPQGEGIKGIDPFDQERVVRVLPRNLFNLNLLVRVASIFDLFGGGFFSPLPTGTPFGSQGGPLSGLGLLMLLQQQGPSGGPSDLTNLLLYSQLFGSGMQGGQGGTGTMNPSLLYFLLGNNGGGDMSPLLLAALSGGGFGGVGQQQPLVISPSSTPLGPGQTQQFTATVGGSSAGVDWVLAPPTLGTLSATGLYTAPPSIPTPQRAVVIATQTAGPQSAAATVNLQPPSSGSTGP